MKQNGDAEMSFLDHLGELRWVLVRCSVAILLMAIVAYFFESFIFNQIIFGPTNPNFITYQFFCEVSKFFGVENICITELPFTIQNTSMEGQINIFISTIIIIGFILAFPYILYQFWNFLSPALYSNEKTEAVKFLFASSLLFFFGVLFGYFIIVPLSVHFFATFKISEMVKNDFNIDSYISMIKTSVIASGIFFEMPVIIYFLTKIGLVSTAFLQKYRKYAIVILLIVAAIVTPPDVVSQLIVVIPLLIIYEISILVSYFVSKKNTKNA